MKHSDYNDICENYKQIGMFFKYMTIECSAPVCQEACHCLPPPYSHPYLPPCYFPPPCFTLADTQPGQGIPMEIVAIQPSQHIRTCFGCGKPVTSDRTVLITMKNVLNRCLSTSCGILSMGVMFLYPSPIPRSLFLLSL